MLKLDAEAEVRHDKGAVGREESKSETSKSESSVTAMHLEAAFKLLVGAAFARCARMP